MAEYNFHHHFSEYACGVFNASWREETPNIPYSLGLHPLDISENWEGNFAKIKEKSADVQCVAIGECGLDARAEASEALQETVFMAHIEWANQLGKPLIIHCVRRFHRLPFFRKKAQIPMIIHGYQKNEILAKSLVNQGFMLSFGKAILHDVSLQNTMKTIGIEYVFLETDDSPISISTLYHATAQIFGQEMVWVKEQIQHNRQKIGIV